MTFNGGNGTNNQKRPLYFNKNIFRMSTTQECVRVCTWRGQLQYHTSQGCVHIQAPRCQLHLRMSSHVPSKMSTSQEHFAFALHDVNFSHQLTRPVAAKMWSIWYLPLTSYTCNCPSCSMWSHFQFFTSQYLAVD